MKKYAEDLTVGAVYPFGEFTLTEADIIDFARVYDPQPMHLDPEYAKAGLFGEIIASGLQTMAVYQRLLVDSLWNHVHGKAGRSVNGKLRAPVRAGSTLTGSATITAISLRSERRDALLALHAELVDQPGTLVLQLDADAILLMRPTN